jgi:DNA-nicking Smr family endonuclease
MSWFKILSRTPKPEKRENAARKTKALKPKRNPLTAEDHAIWSEVVRTIAPLPGRTLPESTTVSLPQPVEMVPTLALSHPVAAPPKTPALPPLARLEKRTLRALSRGSVEIEGRIDLHGMRQSEAHGALNAFLHRAHHSGLRLVLVITGKGGGTDAQGEERGVLRRLVPHWLADPGLRRIVLGYESATRGHGGEGALYVRLRRKP